MEIRQEQKEDIPAIRDLTNAAFEDMAFSDQKEAAIIEILRAQKALVLSLVAVEEGKIIGHIAFSPVTIHRYHGMAPAIGWYGLAPLSVAPSRQNRGIGQALVKEGLNRLQKTFAAKGCVVLGDPDYYGRFGFAVDPRLVYKGAPAAYFQCLAFEPPMPLGEVHYHPAFDSA